ncbi:hypothetical protein MTO96_050979 [Rhipicephalus appendiculatus]
MASTTEGMDSTAEDLQTTPGTSATSNDQEDAAFEDAGFAAGKMGWKVVTSRKTKKKERAETTAQLSQQENHPSGGQVSFTRTPPNIMNRVIRASRVPHLPEDNIKIVFRPKALAAKRIKNSGSVIVVFDGLRIPNFVRYGPTLVPCYLYRRQVDICYVCGKLGHRADVCPDPGSTECRGCGISNPTSSHVCDPQCKLCGGMHVTADKMSHPLRSARAPPTSAIGATRSGTAGRRQATDGTRPIYVKDVDTQPLPLSIAEPHTCEDIDYWRESLRVTGAFRRKEQRSRRHMGGQSQGRYDDHAEGKK